MTDEKSENEDATDYRELTQKEWLFVQDFMEHGNATRAYRKAYAVESDNARHHVIDAFRVKNRPHVALTIRAIRQEQRAAIGVSVDTITEELEDARQLAMAAGTAGPAVSAAMGKAKLHGLVVDKVDTRHLVPPVIHLNRPDHVDDDTDSETIDE